MSMKKRQRIIVYVIAILTALAVGGLSALASSGGMKEFAELNQPPLSPPGWLFPVVWTVLYVLMGISSARVYLSEAKDRKPALIIYAVQLVVNALWTPIFFELELRLVAFVWILLLIGLVIYMITLFCKADRKAAYLQIPYLVWLVFAAYLNLGVYLLNR